MEDEYIYFSKMDLEDESEKFDLSEGIDIDHDGYVYVADEAGFVRKLDFIGSLIKKWGGRGNKDGEFTVAYALAIDASNRILLKVKNLSDRLGIDIFF